MKQKFEQFFKFYYYFNVNIGKTHWKLPSDDLK